MRRLRLPLWISTMVLAASCGEPERVPVCPGEPPPPPPGLDPALEARVETWLAAMSLDEKIAQMHGSGPSEAGLWETAADPRLGIPGFHMTDGPRGVTAGNATCFPVGMARGATFDRELEEAIGAAIGLETAARGGDVILAPTVNVLRHPAWGRAQETYGEDPYHLGELGAAFVTGAQRHVIATAKHLAANSIEDTRLDVDVRVDERALREVYLPQFRTLVRRAGVGAVMSAYNQVNGVYASENAFLLHDVLKTEWGFAGLVMSDWVFGTHSAAPAVQAGLDLEMPTVARFNDLAGAVARCELSEAVIDDAVRRILRTKLRFGLEARPVVDPAVIESPAHAELALRAARESLVLLRNQGDALPLDPAGPGPIAVVGALADVANLGDRGSSGTTPSRAVTPLAGLRARFGADQVLHVLGDTLDPNTRAMVTGATAAVVVVGLTDRDEGENLTGSGGDRETLALAAADVALIEDVAAANPRTVVVLEGGSALVTAPWIDDVAAVVMAWYPGQEGGTAIAELLAGDVSPSGRLPVSWPVAEADLPPFDHTSLQVEYGLFHGYRWLDRNGTAPAFPFGFGLSYGEVAYDAVALAASAVARDGVVRATVTVRSVDRTGAEVVQLYVAPPAVAGVERAVRELRGFARVSLVPGQTAQVGFEVPVADLARFDPVARAWVVDPGTYEVAVGRDARELPLRASFTVE